MLTQNNNTPLRKANDSFMEWIKLAGLDTKQHQIDGINWCLNRELNTYDFHCNSCNALDIRGGILADEMGLGKTILMLGCIYSNIYNGFAKTLIVVPPALLHQWYDCIVKFFKGVEPIVYHGYKAKSVDFRKLKLAPASATAIVLTTYGMINTRRDKKYVSPLWNLQWDRVIFDEAHHMRNHKSNSFKGALKLKTRIKWFVTGTPIQNYKRDLENILQLLGLQKCINNHPAKCDEFLNAFILKRTKKEVGLKIPPITEQVIEVPSNGAEKTLLSHLHSTANFSNINIDNIDEIIQMLDGKGILPIMTACRQACIYPRLLTNKWLEMSANGIINGNIDIPQVDTHSKLTAVVDTIVKNKRKGKSIIFCHYHGEMKQIKAMLEYNQLNVCCFNGKTKKSLRKNLLRSNTGWADMFIYPNSKVHQFLGKGELLRDLLRPYLTPDVLILQIKSACEGLNLQDYNQVYFVSPHWNPAVEDQALARAYRIGQKKPVFVYKFITTLPDVRKRKAEFNTVSLDQYCTAVQTFKRRIMSKLDDIVKKDISHKINTTPIGHTNYSWNSNKNIKTPIGHTNYSF
tara:strand:+ start:2307 stop:4025 length:1719 start_codon:yes stop_codon:yes gene_type:complete